MKFVRPRPEDMVIVHLHERMRALQMRDPPRPKKKNGEPLNPVLPLDMTQLDDQALGKLYTQFSIMAQWAIVVIARVAAKRGALRQVDKRVRAEFRIRQEGTVSDKNDAVEANPAIKAIAIELLKAEMEEKLTQSYMDGYVIGRETCSRELTRRQSIGPSGELSRRR